MSNPMIHLSSSHANNENMLFPNTTEQYHSTNNSSLTEDLRYIRCQTRWHPMFPHHQQGLIPHSATSMSRHSPPNLVTQALSVGQQNTDSRSPNSTPTSDLFICLIKSINKSNLKLHHTIIKQQETLKNHQKVLTPYLYTESSLQKDHTTLMQKQLNAIIALVHAKP